MAPQDTKQVCLIQTTIVVEVGFSGAILIGSKRPERIDSSRCVVITMASSTGGNSAVDDVLEVGCLTVQLVASRNIKVGGGGMVDIFLGSQPIIYCKISLGVRQSIQNQPISKTLRQNVHKISTYVENESKRVVAVTFQQYRTLPRGPDCQGLCPEHMESISEQKPFMQ